MMHSSIAAHSVVDRDAFLPSGHSPSWYFLVAVLGCWFTMSQQALAVPGRLSSFTTAAVDKETKLTSVTIDDVRQTIPVSQLIGIDLVYFMVTTAGTGNTPAVLSPNTDVIINQNPRSNLLDFDEALNSGIINVPGGSGIEAGKPFNSIFDPEAPPTGFGFRFLEPVTNGLGDDFLFFDLINGTSPLVTPDTFLLTLFVDDVSVGSTTVAMSNYLIPQTITLLTTKIFPQANPMATLANLEERALNASQATINPRATGGSFDFSTLGVAENARVTGFFLNSTSFFDPVFMAGIRPVPEPSSLILAISGCMLFLRLRASRRGPTGPLRAL